MTTNKIKTGAATPVAIVVDGGVTQDVAVTGQPIQVESAISSESAAASFSAFGEQLVSEVTLQAAILAQYNVNADSITSTTTGSGTVTHDDVFAVLSTTAATSSSAKINSKRIAEYRPRQGIEVVFTALFTNGVEGSTQIIGIGDDTDGFYFGYNGTSFGIMRRSGGSDNWIAQGDWNIDKADGTGELQNVNTAIGNVYKIQFQWLGFGAISFFIENSETGGFELVHRIKYANTASVTSIKNPSLPLMAYVENDTNNTNVVLKTPSMGAYLQGRDNPTGLTRSVANTKSGIDTTLTNILTIANKGTYQGKNNHTVVELLFLSIASDGNKNCDFKLVKDATLGGSPSYTDISTNTSVIEYDVAGTTVTGGINYADFFVGKVDADTEPLSELKILLNAGETLTIAANTTSTGSGNEVSGSLVWFERML